MSITQNRYQLDFSLPVHSHNYYEKLVQYGIHEIKPGVSYLFNIGRQRCLFSNLFCPT